LQVFLVCCHFGFHPCEKVLMSGGLFEYRSGAILYGGFASWLGRKK
jgi:hypothetical protein